MGMHDYTEETQVLARSLVAYARNRIASPQPWTVPSRAQN